MRISNLWAYIYSYKEFICMSAVLIILLSLVLPYLIDRFDYRKGRGLVFFYLYQRNRREICYISVILMEALFVLYCILFRRNVDVDCILWLTVSAVVIMATGRKWKLVIIEILHAVVLAAALLCGNIMFRYLEEVRMDMFVLVLYILLNIFIITYLIYFVIWHLAELKYTQAVPAAGRKEELFDEEFEEDEEESEE